MSSAPLLEVNVEGGKLRAISLHDACNRVGAFYDLWISDPEKATAALKRSKVHPLRGCFDPAEPESEVEALEKEDAGLRLAREKISAKIEGKSTEYWVAGALLAFSLLFPQIYVSVFHAQGGFGPAMTDGGALLVGLASVALTAAAFYSYQELLPRQTEKGKLFRQAVTTYFVDALCFNKLRVKPKIAAMFLGSFTATILSSAILTLLSKSVAILTFGHLVAGFLLTAGGILVGETATLRSLRQRSLIEMLQGAARDCRSKLNDQEVELKAKEFLAHPPHQDFVVLDLELLTLLANSLPRKAVHSVRLRRFLVRHAKSVPDDYPVENDGMWLGAMTHRSDVLVDVFVTPEASGAAQALSPGKSKHRPFPKREAWDAPLAWHLGLRPESVRGAEEELCGKGVELGSAAAAPGPKGRHLKPPKWESNEVAVELFAHEQAAEELEAGLRALTATLESVASKFALPDERKAELVGALLKGGAEVKGKTGWSNPAWYCAANDHVKSLKVILDSGLFDWDARCGYGTLIESVQKVYPNRQAALELLRGYEERRRRAA